jgi:hypothetical protein
LEAVAGMAVSRRSRAVEKMRMEVLVRINHGAHGRRSCSVKGPRVTSRRLRFEWLLVTFLMLIVRSELLVCTYIKDSAFVRSCKFQKYSLYENLIFPIQVSSVRLP